MCLNILRSDWRNLKSPSMGYDGSTAWESFITHQTVKLSGRPARRRYVRFVVASSSIRETALSSSSGIWKKREEWIGTVCAKPAWSPTRSRRDSAVRNVLCGECWGIRLFNCMFWRASKLKPEGKIGSSMLCQPELPSLQMRGDYLNQLSSAVWRGNYN